MQLAAVYLCALGGVFVLLAKLTALRFANLATVLLAIGMLLASIAWIIYY
jgi:hypothetical protein